MAFMRPLTVEAAIEDGIVPHISGRGEKFVQLYQRIPFGKYLYFPFEINYETHHGVNFTAEHWVLPIVIVTVYMAAVYFGQKYMATRQRMDLRYKLAGWNAFLCIFSFIGALRTVPDLLYRFGSEPLSSTICNSDWGYGATGLWVQLFIFSKIPELIDTYFIVARQRPLIFLHWYHHVTVLLYCWHSYATEASQALYFVAMNYTVHAIMYGYYCLMALKIKPPIPDFLITGMQISQMVVGTFIQLASMYYYSPGKCGVHYGNLVAGGLMYGSYFALFFHFAYERFVLKPKKAVKKTE